MSTDLFDRYASLDPANSPQAAPDWASTAPVLLSAIDERTSQMQTQTTTQDDALVPATPPRKSRNGMLVAAAVFAIVVIAGGVLAIVFTEGEPQPAASVPEDVVAELIEATNARDVDALAALYDPEIVYSYDASLGGGSFIRDATGHEDVLALLEEVWATYNTTVTSYVVRSVDGATVTTAEMVEISIGSAGHIVTYEVSDDGLILLQKVAVRPQ